MTNVAEPSGPGNVEPKEKDGHEPDRTPSQASTSQRRVSSASQTGGFKLVAEEPPPLIKQIPTVGNMEFSSGKDGSAHQVMLLDSQASFPESMLLLATMDPEHSFPDAHAPTPLSPVVAPASRGSSRAGSRATSPHKSSSRGGNATTKDLKSVPRSQNMGASSRNASPSRTTGQQRLSQQTDSRAGRRSPSPTNSSQNRLRSNGNSTSLPGCTAQDADKTASEKKTGEKEHGLEQLLNEHGLEQLLPTAQPRKKAHSLTALYQESLSKFADMWPDLPEIGHGGIRAR